MRANRRDVLAGLAGAALALGPPAAALSPRSPLQQLLDEERAKHGVPALTVMVIQGDRVLAHAVSGVRANGRAAPARLLSRWHIGSCGKAMTAAMIARLVDRGALDWGTTPADVFADLAPRMDPAARSITLAQLLSMTAGLPPNPSFAAEQAQVVADVRAFAARAPTLKGQRRAVVADMLGRPPKTEPGAVWEYCNTGFVIAGAMAETVASSRFERLMQQELAAPLAMEGFGFGPPGGGEPLGHTADLEPLPFRHPRADNPAYFAPAGGMHMPMSAWARFLTDQIAGHAGQGRLLRPETYARMQTPFLPEGIYGFGWGVQRRDGRTVALAHQGSNTHWLAETQLYLESGHAILMAANDGRDDAVLPAFRALRRHLKEAHRIA